MVRYHPVLFHIRDLRLGVDRNVRAAADRFEMLNGVAPQIVTRDTIGVDTNKYWYVAWLWDVVPCDVEYVLYMDERILPVRKLPELPELKFAAAMDRHDRVNQGLRRSEIMRKTGKYFQLNLFVAHRDTQPLFERLKTLSTLDRYNFRDGKPSDLGFDGRGNFTPMNEVIQEAVPVHELSRDWNWLITYEKQYYFENPYMINFLSNEYGTWSYYRFVRQLIEQVEANGGSMDPSE
jgi:hypothetical protein